MNQTWIKPEPNLNQTQIKHRSNTNQDESNVNQTGIKQEWNMNQTWTKHVSYINQAELNKHQTRKNIIFLKASSENLTTRKHYTVYHVRKEDNDEQ
jgi:hypothetical protein